MLLYRKGEGEEHFDVFLDIFGGVGAGFGVGPDLFVLFFVEDPGGVEAEVDADVAVLFVGGVVEVGSEGDDFDGVRDALPGSVQTADAGFVRGVPWPRGPRFR